MQVPTMANKSLIAFLLIVILNLLVTALPVNSKSSVEQRQQFKRFRGEPIRFGKRVPREPISQPYVSYKNKRVDKLDICDMSAIHLLVTLATLFAIIVGQDYYNEKRSPLGTMRFGKRMAIDDNYYYLDKKADSTMAETQRSIRTPLGTMRFGKRTSLRLEKRNPLSTMRFG
uniref:Uncharacterized protein n=1 Tax=Heterorhabditis bacteriophora TaxID=37862 RepID=A0A1I7X910_HETBA